MVVQVHVLSVGSVEMAPSLLVTTETQRLLFNVGDGTQRMCMEHHVRLAKMRNVFLTELRAHTLGGLPGMVLTVSDTGKAGLRVHGPVGTKRYLRATRHFLYRPQFQLDAMDVAPTPTAASQMPVYSDDGDEVQVFAIATSVPHGGVKRKLHEVAPTMTQRAAAFLGIGAGAAAGSTTDSSSRSVSTTTTSGDDGDDGGFANDCVSYVVETKALRGKFLVDRARALGVPKGKLFGQLHHGQDVTLPDGRIVKSADCVSPSLPAGGCAIIACRSVAFVDSLVRSDQFARYQWGHCRNRSSAATTTTATTTEDGQGQDQEQVDSEAKTAPEVQLQIVYHLGDRAVLHHPAYIAWVQRFGAQVEHVLLTYDGCPEKTVYRASAKLVAQLHAVFPSSFSSMEYEHRDAQTAFSRRVEMPFTTSTQPAVLGESLLKYTLTPPVRRGFDASSCFPRIQEEEVLASTAGFRAQLAQRREEDHTKVRPELPCNAGVGRVTFLGTGCAIPSNYRNVTGIYLELPSREQESVTTSGERIANGMMLDCGEGTLGQMYRHTGGDTRRLRAMVRNLKCIWISHNHADHHLGIVRILSYRHALQQVENDADELEPLLIVGPTPVESWLQEYAAIDPTVAGMFTFVDNFCFDEQDKRFQGAVAVASPTRVALRELLEITNLECVHVKHAFRAYAVVFTWRDTLKIAFSGDCRPSDLLAEKAKDAFLLIHEATFEDSMGAEAKQKDHATTGEAIEVGRKAHAQHVILTHFSQRYPKVSAMGADEKGKASENGDVMSAMDLLTLSFADLHHGQAEMMAMCTQILAMDDTGDEDTRS